MSKRNRHPDPEIESAVRYAEQLGWTLRMSKHGHAWAVLYCPQHTREGCKIGVYSTPRNTGNHARHIRAAVDRCPHPDAGGL